MAENKVTFGLTNVHYAVVTETDDGIDTYGEPKRLRGATELTFEPRGESSDFYADNMLYYSTTTNQGYEGTLSVALLPTDFRVDVLGDVMTDGVLTESSNAKTKRIAFMFEFDGDQKATRHVMYNCTVSRPGFGSSTKTETSEPGTSELTFVAAPRYDGIVKRSTTDETSEVVYDAWYETVFDPEVTPTI